MWHVILAVFLLINQSGNFFVESATFFPLTATINQEKAPEKINPDNVGVKITADKFFVVDVESGKVLLENNSNIRQPIASITKLMTAMVILDLRPDWKKVVTMLPVDETVGARPHLYRGEEIKFVDLWKAALISSDNNAIMAMVRSLGFTRAEFVELMNAKARELNLYNTIFADPTGLDIGNLSTAHDVAKLVHNALKYNEIRESVVSGKDEIEILNKKNRTIYNTDILIDSFLNNKQYGYELIGGKTGFLPEAGYCLAVQVMNMNNQVMIVVLNSQTIETRFQDTKILADWVFTNYQWP